MIFSLDNLEFISAHQERIYSHPQQLPSHRRIHVLSTVLIYSNEVETCSRKDFFHKYFLIWSDVIDCHGGRKGEFSVALCFAHLDFITQRKTNKPITCVVVVVVVIVAVVVVAAAAAIVVVVIVVAAVVVIVVVVRINIGKVNFDVFVRRKEI